MCSTSLCSHLPRSEEDHCLYHKAFPELQLAAWKGQWEWGAEEEGEAEQRQTQVSAVQPWEDTGRPPVAGHLGVGRIPGCGWRRGGIRGQEVGAEVPGATWVELYSDLSHDAQQLSLGGTCW